MNSAPDPTSGPTPERDSLLRLFRGLGATETQSAVMADQLAKRCDQLVASRGIPREEAMRYLLALVVKGRAGEAPGTHAPTGL